MRPRYLTGDMVRLRARGEYRIWGDGMVISVQQANNVPDAKERGLQGLQPWSYYVLLRSRPWQEFMISGPWHEDEVLPWTT